MGVIEFERVADSIVIRESEGGEVTGEVRVPVSEIDRLHVNLHWLGQMASQGGVLAVGVVLSTLRKKLEGIRG